MLNQSKDETTGQIVDNANEEDMSRIEATDRETRWRKMKLESKNRTSNGAVAPSTNRPTNNSSS